MQEKTCFSARSYQSRLTETGLTNYKDYRKLAETGSQTDRINLITSVVFVGAKSPSAVSKGKNTMCQTKYHKNKIK